jgi:uncharacterized membrane protein
MFSARYQWVDALRGFAMVWMTGFHFCFDLANAGLLQANFYQDPVWTAQRSCILSLFLLCAGAGQAIAMAQAQTWQRFSKRWLQIAGCALLVTISSYIMFPRSFIYFGVLHGMAVMLLISRIVGPRGRWLWAAGLLLIALKWIAPWAITEGWWDSALNDKPLNWLGLISIKPITEDYVPLVPWLGVMLWGIAAMQWVLNRHAAHALHQADIPALRPLAFLGRWSLSYYMLHQPVMLGALWLWQRV